MRRLIQLMLLMAALPLAATEVYKSVDENGNVVYSDRPRFGASFDLVEVDSSFLGGGPASRQSFARAEPEADGAADDGQQAGDEQSREAVRAQNCETARERNERYMTSHRLYRETSDGEREYLSSEEIDEARAQAAADVEEWCS